MPASHQHPEKHKCFREQCKLAQIPGNLLQGPFKSLLQGSRKQLLVLSTSQCAAVYREAAPSHAGSTGRREAAGRSDVGLGSLSGTGLRSC